jgi:hypothetical protein
MQWLKDVLSSTRYTTGRAYVILADHLQTPQQTQIGVEKLIVDAAVSARKHDVYTDKLSSMPGCLHFYGEVIRGLDRIRRRVESEQEVLLRATKGLDCEYHEHGANEICYRKMFPATRSGARHSQNSIPDNQIVDEMADLTDLNSQDREDHDRSVSDQVTMLNDPSCARMSLRATRKSSKRRLPAAGKKPGRISYASQRSLRKLSKCL